MADQGNLESTEVLIDKRDGVFGHMQHMTPQKCMKNVYHQFAFLAL